MDLYLACFDHLLLVLLDLGVTLVNQLLPHRMVLDSSYEVLIRYAQDHSRLANALRGRVVDAIILIYNIFLSHHVSSSDIRQHQLLELGLLLALLELLVVLASKRIL